MESGIEERTRPGHSTQHSGGTTEPRKSTQRSAPHRYHTQTRQRREHGSNDSTVSLSLPSHRPPVHLASSLCCTVLWVRRGRDSLGLTAERGEGRARARRTDKREQRSAVARAQWNTTQHRAEGICHVWTALCRNFPLPNATKKSWEREIESAGVC